MEGVYVAAEGPPLEVGSVAVVSKVLNRGCFKKYFTIWSVKDNKFFIPRFFLNATSWFSEFKRAGFFASTEVIKGATFALLNARWSDST